MGDMVRWGILGTGVIAKKFAKALKALPDAELSAVGSRAAETAEGFAREFGVKRAHASYEELATDAGVDVVYVSTPHHLHCENTLLCLRHGKAVLCEKPFAINAREARRMADEARNRRLFLMEAMWTRFLPAITQARAWMASGAIGDARMVIADFGFRAEINPQGRLFNPAFGGGGLLDVGVYPISLASFVFGGAPVDVTGAAHIGETGVDEQAGIVLRYRGGELAVLACGVRTETPHDAYILGSGGSIRLHAPFWCTTRATLRVKDEEAVEFVQEHLANGYEYQAMEVARCLRNGATESSVVTLDESVSILETMDRLREMWGLRYPME